MPGAARHERARAKVNLTLHVLGRLADGYHDLESLVAFAEFGDDLEGGLSEHSALAVAGPFAPALEHGEADRPNLVSRAVAALATHFGRTLEADLRLTKRLPVASGIGGGSADAAAALRLLAGELGLAADDTRVLEAAASLGADVPVCLLSRAAWMQGRGERVRALAAFPAMPALLVNPGVAVETAPVFAALGLAPGEVIRPSDGDHPQAFASPEILIDFLHVRRNDLEAVTVGLSPAVGDVLDVLGALEGVRLARMSGSGATCFALFDALPEAEQAAGRIRAARPDWWCQATLLR